MAKSWIHPEELQLVSDQMSKFGRYGRILEVGEANGQLIEFVKTQHPEWAYQEIYAPSALGFNSDYKYDVISIGVTEEHVNWHALYKHIKQYLSDSGILVARNIRHTIYASVIKQAVKNLNFVKLDEANQCVALKNNVIHYGNNNIDLDIYRYHLESNSLLSAQNVKISGSLGHNRFVSTPPDTKTYLSTYVNNYLNIKLDWNFEYFKSGEPAGLHTDYVSLPNTWRVVDNNLITHDCHIVMGVIIPLEWSCKQPYTVNYDRVSKVPRKLIYRKGEMRYMDNDEVFKYRPDDENEWWYDKEVTQFNPAHTEYYKEYACLNIHSVYEWKLGTMMVFDTARWHSSSWFLSDNKLPAVSHEYKKSIIGFGSIDIDRDEIPK